MYKIIVDGFTIYMKKTIHNILLFKTKSDFKPPRNRSRDLDHQIDILNNVDLKGMETCSQNNLSKMQLSEFSKLNNDRTIVIELPNDEYTEVILSTEYYKKNHYVTSRWC